MGIVTAIVTFVVLIFGLNLTFNLLTMPDEVVVVSNSKRYVQTSSTTSTTPYHHHGMRDEYFYSQHRRQHSIGGSSPSGSLKLRRPPIESPCHRHFKTEKPPNSANSRRSIYSNGTNATARCIEDDREDEEEQSNRNLSGRVSRAADFFSFSTSWVFVLLAFLGRRFPREPQAMSLRLAFASVSIGGFIVICLYR